MDNKRNDRRKQEFRKSDRPSPPFRNEEEMDECIVSGRNAVRELLESGRDIEKIYIQSGEREGSVNQLIGIASERRLQIVEVDKRKLDQLSYGQRHQGIVAVAAERNYASVEEILAYAEEKGEKPFVILLDGVEDPHNLGAIIRSAECVGAHGVIIPKRRAVGLTSTVAKASAGAIEHMRVAKVTNLSQTIDELKDRGLWIYGADMGENAYYEVDMTGSVCLVLGSEGFGISRLVKEKCDFIVSIPMCGRVNSMNVSCAGAIIMSDISRQRRTKAR